MFVHGPDADVQCGGDFLVNASLAQEVEHLALARGELLQRIFVSASRKERGDDDRIDRRTAGGDAPHRRDELLDVADPIFQQISDALRGVGQQLHREPQFHVLRQHQHAHRWIRGPDLERRP
jgi:hypothetical protein